MRTDATGSYHALPLRSVRTSHRPASAPRLWSVLAWLLGATRRASPPPGVAWRRALLALIRKLLAMALIVAFVTSR